MKRTLLIAVALSCLLLGQSPEPATVFRVKHVAEGAVYLEGGRNAGLCEGMKLSIRKDSGPSGGSVPQVMAELEVIAVATSSAVCEIRNPQGEIQPGDNAYLSLEDAETLRTMKSSQASGKYLQVVTFSEGDPLDEEARAAIPRPQPAEVNRARGRIGFEYNTIRQAAGGGYSSQVGLVFRGDMTRVGGSYWSLSGYWRGRMDRRNGDPQVVTMTDLLNRTYHLTLSYNNPQSPWMAGFGRLYLPWAASLETIDGGYVAHRLGRSLTVGAFGGSTPDPTAWNYNPNRQLLGSFVNYTAGDFESIRFTSTSGAAASRIHWRPERQFAFFENTLFFKRYMSIYHNLEADQIKERAGSGENGVRVSRSFLTLRFQPVRFLSLDLSHNYFRDVPTFDPRLVATGLVDKFLFQGATAGFKLELPLRSAAYASFGRSNRSGDTRHSLNQMYGLTKTDILRTGVRADARYSKFDGSFGRGTYRALSLSREFSEALRFEMQCGEQTFASGFTSQTRARFVNSTLDWFLATHYVLGGGYTIYRSQTQSYDQLYVNLGYRFGR